MTYDLVIQGGTLVTATDMFLADVGISEGKIAAIGRNLGGAHLLDARGKLVIPGGVDPHVHLQMPTGVTVSSDNWQTGTVAAAHGGTTTVIDFVEPEPGETLLEAFERRRAEADGLGQDHGGAVIDYGLHMTLGQPALDRLDEVPDCVAAGMTSFKTYTTYEGMKLTDAEFLRVMETVRDAGGLVITHCENDAIIAHLTRWLVADDHTAPRFHPVSRPALTEIEAIQRVLALAAVAGVPVYIVHVSTGGGAAALARARATGQPVWGETCPQYLLLDDERYAEPGFAGAKYVCSPPLRAPADQGVLWDALRVGTLQAVGTDHCPFHFAGQKDLGLDDFTAIPGGMPGIEARLALLYTFGVRAGRLTPGQWVAACCTCPAQIFGLYPRKGSLVPGADADIVIFDPARAVTLTQELLHENVDYTPYEGLNVTGWPETTISRGEIIVHQGAFMGRPGRGRYLERHRFSRPI